MVGFQMARPSILGLGPGVEMPQQIVGQISSAESINVVGSSDAGISPMTISTPAEASVAPPV